MTGKKLYKKRSSYKRSSNATNRSVAQNRKRRLKKVWKTSKRVALPAAALAALAAALASMDPELVSWRAKDLLNLNTLDPEQVRLLSEMDTFRSRLSNL